MATVQRIDTPRGPARLSAELLDRLPPQNLEAERAVLASILLDPQMSDEVALLIRPEDFYADANQKLYRHITTMREKGKQVDTLLLIERLKQEGDFEAIGGAAYLSEVARSEAVAAHATYYAEIVRDKAVLRALLHAGTEIVRDAYDTTADPKQIVSQAEQKVFAIHDERSADQITNAHDLMIEAFNRIDARAEGTEGVGLSSGFTDFDSLTGGLHDSELIILAARPSMGKTALATNIAENVSIRSQATTLFVSLEMARLELAQRLLCSQGEIDATKFRSGFLSRDDRAKLIEASAELSRAPLYIDDTPSRTVTEIAAAARRLKRKENLRLVIIDYLQLIQPDDPRDPRQEQVAKMARRLKCLARELKVPIICLSQLNRQVEVGREPQRPRLSNLRESGAIEQDADVVLFIHRDEVYMKPDDPELETKRGLADVIVAKQRNGPTGDFQLAWFGKFTRFKNHAQKPYQEFEPRGGGDYGGDF
jgi:replicative DNA helicase